MLRAHIDKLRIIYASDICESGANGYRSTFLR